MKNLKSIILLTVFAIATIDLSAGIYNNNNQSAAFMRNPARSATYEVDGVYYNPAGTVFNTEGWHIGINNASAWQERKLESNFPLLGQKNYDTKINSLVIPAVYASYVTDKWAFSGYFMAMGGGGTAEYENGLPSFESLVRAGLASKLPAGVTYDYASAFEGTLMSFSAQLGASYKFNDNFSAYAGVRAVMHSNKYNGFLSATNVQVGGMLLMPQAVDMQLDTKQGGIGIAPVLGLNYNHDRFNIGVKYEFNVGVEMENDTEKLIANMAGSDASAQLGAFKDGVKTNKDIPALLTVGASYDLLENLKLSAAWWHHFDQNADWGGKEDLLNGDTNEFMWGLEYTISPKWLVSCGMAISRYGVDEKFWTDMEQVLDSETYAIGFRYSFTENIKFDLGVYTADYKNPYTDTNNYDALDAQLGQAMGTTLNSIDTYERSSFLVGLGLSFNF